MLRSEINERVREAEQLFSKHSIHLPPFANWTPDDWKARILDAQEIVTCGLGWDVTDFGRGDFPREGLLLFTLRNGCSGDARYPKPYAEKLMMVQEGQVTLMHHHRCKMEDIIVRAGGGLVFQLYVSAPDGSLSDSPVTVSRDGVTQTVPAGGLVRLSPGESLTLVPGVYHQFWGEPGSGPVLAGEVSSVNDDRNDNVYHQPQSRYPAIEEDTHPYRLLVSDYERVLQKQWRG